MGIKFRFGVRVKDEGRLSDRQTLLKTHQSPVHCLLHAIRLQLPGHHHVVEKGTVVPPNNFLHSSSCSSNLQKIKKPKNYKKKKSRGGGGIFSLFFQSIKFGKLSDKNEKIK